MTLDLVRALREEWAIAVNHEAGLRDSGAPVCLVEAAEQTALQSEARAVAAEHQLRTGAPLSHETGCTPEVGVSY